MGRDKQSCSSAAPVSGAGTLELVEKALRVGRFPKALASGKPEIDEDTGKPKTEFWSIDARKLAESVSGARVYVPSLAAATTNNSSSSNSKATRGAAAATSSKQSQRQEQHPSSSSSISIANLDAMAAVALLAKQNHHSPAVLVFASDTNAGGSRGAKNKGTQEENIVCNSTLSVPQQKKLAAQYPIPLLGVAYAPEVISLDAVNGPLPFGAIACALRLAIADFDSGPSQKEKQFLLDKMNSILVCAAEHGHRSLVLGAIGCGAFGGEESAPAVAEAFKTALSNPIAKCFSQVVFAIPSAPLRQIFEKAFA